MRSFPSRRIFTLSCEYFGIAGHYALFLRPTTPSPALPHISAYIKVRCNIKLSSKDKYLLYILMANIIISKHK